MENLSVGVIGVGHLGKLHTKMFNQISNCNLMGDMMQMLIKQKLLLMNLELKHFLQLMNC